jgi:hypothetical protein
MEPGSGVCPVPLTLEMSQLLFLPLAPLYFPGLRVRSWPSPLQIAVAMGDAAVAATSINKRLALEGHCVLAESYQGRRPRVKRLATPAHAGGAGAARHEYGGSICTQAPPLPTPPELQKSQPQLGLAPNAIFSAAKPQRSASSVA